MSNKGLISWFLPKDVRHNKMHPRYFELYTVAAPTLAAVAALCLLPMILSCFGVGKHLELYYIDAACHIVTLFAIRMSGHYRTFNIISAFAGYFILYTWIEDTGLIYSVNICLVHLFLLGGVLVDRKWGWITIFSNLAFLAFIYHESIIRAVILTADPSMGSPLYALLMNCIITVFLGGFLAFTLSNNEKSRKKIITLRDKRIDLLDEVVRKRTEQLNSMRKTIAADFHDQTGNMLAAINRQASILELKLKGQAELLPLVEGIIANSNDLYASSKDFLWTLNHDSDNPNTLFKYLTGYGQSFYNQFDIAFSAEIISKQDHPKQLTSFAALNLIYIFKEAMSNVIRHSGASDVSMYMRCTGSEVLFSLTDNGRWKEADPATAHYGLGNISRRSQESGFTYTLTHDDQGTCITIGLPLNIYHTDQ